MARFAAVLIGVLVVLTACDSRDGRRLEPPVFPPPVVPVATLPPAES